MYGAIGVFFVATALATLGHIQMKLHANLNGTKKVAGRSMGYGWLGDQIVANRYIGFALCAYIGGGLIDLSVNRFIPFYIRACFAALDIPIYAVLARLILGEVMDLKQVMGVVISVCGCVGAVLAGAQPVKNRSEDDVLNELFSHRVGISLLVTLPLFLGSLYVVWRAVNDPSQLARHDEPVKTRFGLFLSAVFASSYAATWASLSVRCVSELAQFGIFTSTTMGMIVFLVLTCVVQVATIADMMKLFSSIISMPPYLILNAGGLSAYSAVVFGETPQHAAAFVVTMIVAFGGIGFIVHSDESSTQEISPEKLPLTSHT